ncbi:MAG: 2-nitropropane dioxygenase [Alphaproteobacteria bacterium GWC2_42_16]|nr:MAG: 2-nitropropane dioxygenase [Alphaproteobacteria bacterium GWC2_42_16]OFW73973.1 MAG: 2-nitropropane dioxygenase [Alphaproteobacteria bacterium GWA2_41_27]OFW82547.1 MAG: 2-nitropropane dioxygenase [Alphaproteobacteria bacterium RIFCSPHIGHO2_12_FULL_42_100]OFW85827.1 MAG: 2-nitropropane dioxygenase [Alphaproteobacteria bacterium RBG_16_42_14]OFW90638.1 MAG: 2-nitropropane dioxygenase [Alphaproteobacteria bacterium RIFCSPHIGHO2_12_42_13]OFW91586.1 MAG: 2-nitropropane dioxygenase [Alphapr
MRKKGRSVTTKRLDELWKRGKDFLGTQYAILGGAMTWVSERNLVSAISNAGGFGVIASGAMSPDLLRTEIKATQELTSKPFGVNLITMHPQLMDLIDICIQENITHVVLAGGLPPTQAITKLKENGIKVLCFAPALVLARKLIKLGVDALIVEGMEAGGHIGPVSTSVLVQEILPHIKDIPVFVAGGIGRGEAIVSYLEMGAAGCQLGTHFVCTTECIAHPDFKKAFLRAQARDAIIAPQLDGRFPVIPVRALANQATKDFIDYQRKLINQVDQGILELKEAQLKIEHFWAGTLKRAVIEGDIEHGSMMAGQSVGMVTHEQPTQDVINELILQATSALESRTMPKAAALC